MAKKLPICWGNGGKTEEKSEEFQEFPEKNSKMRLTWRLVSVILFKLARAGAPKGAEQERAGANLENDTEEVNAQL